MTRHADHKKVSTSDRGSLTLEQNTIIDDSLLPAADELAKLNAISPDLVTWVTNRAEKEQEARIRFNEDNMKLAQSDHKFARRYNMTALIMAFIIVCLFLVGAYSLIINGHTVIGSIFGGGAIIVVAYFLQAKPAKK